MSRKSIFNTVQFDTPQGNHFNLSHDVKMTGKFGDLMPVLVMECIPGDKVKLGCQSFMRLAPMDAPVMHRADQFVHYFFVPNRIIWPKQGANEGWEDFITNKPTGGLPFITLDAGLNPAQEKFLDYMGLPPFSQLGTTVATPVSALPFAAYQKIYNDYYRDQNLITEVPVAYTLTDGDNSANIGVLCQLRKRAWEHDYFTSALTTAQAGPEVDMPLGDITAVPTAQFTTQIPHFRDTTGGIDTGDIVQTAGQIDITPGDKNLYDPDGTLVVEPTTITTLRRAFKLQEFLERLNRGGKRYIEMIKVFFGVSSSDKRLDRPEYITGSRAPIVISEVLNTAGATNADGPIQGNMSGHGASVLEGYGKEYFCEEHGYIIGIMSVMPKPAYAQGIPRHYLKFDNLDYYWPQFAHIGEQAIFNHELYAYQATGDDAFGYIPRYAEYKYMQPRIVGDMRTVFLNWHMARIFADLPVLDEDFVEMDAAEVDRIFTVQTTDDDLIIQLTNLIKARRPMPVFGSPMM